MYPGTHRHTCMYKGTYTDSHACIRVNTDTDKGTGTKSLLSLPHYFTQELTAAKHVSVPSVYLGAGVQDSLSLSFSLSLFLFVCVYLGGGLRECVMMLFMSSYVSTSSSPSAQHIW
jgi:hypothetical protein